MIKKAVEISSSQSFFYGLLKNLIEIFKKTLISNDSRRSKTEMIETLRKNSIIIIMVLCA